MENSEISTQNPYAEPQAWEPSPQAPRPTLRSRSLALKSGLTRGAATGARIGGGLYGILTTVLFASKQFQTTAWAENRLLRNAVVLRFFGQVLAAILVGALGGAFVGGTTQGLVAFTRNRPPTKPAPAPDTSEAPSQG